MPRDRDKPLDVLSVADLCVDLVLTGDVVPRFGQAEQLVDDYHLELGGSATIFAGQLVKLGARAGILGSIGADLFGDFVAGRLAGLGVATERVVRAEGVRTGLGVALVKESEDRTMLTYAGTIDATAPEHLTHDLPSLARHWHISSFFLLSLLRPTWASWLRRCRQAGLTTSLDTNWDPAETWDGVHEILPLIDVFLPNATEACAIAGESDVELAGRTLAGFGCVVVVKQGADGATAFHENDMSSLDLSEEAPPPRIVDSIGAGDCFDAGFLRGWILGWGIEACLRLGHRCGRASLSEAGGFRGQLVEDVSGNTLQGVQMRRSR
ncbi:carbohydrate kinase [Candidatus Poribacteria bacterium]|nr:carbohydrate kinase [Candidatus Poribacteria bacterium]